MFEEVEHKWHSTICLMETKKSHTQEVVLIWLQ